MEGGGGCIQGGLVSPFLLVWCVAGGCVWYEWCVCGVRVGVCVYGVWCECGECGMSGVRWAGAEPCKQGGPYDSFLLFLSIAKTL